MRIVYDDKMQNEFLDAVEMFMDGLKVKEVIEKEYGMERVQMDVLKKALNDFLCKNFDMEISENVTHAHGIGNNCKYPVYYHEEGSAEIQQCAYINLNSGMFGEGFLSCEDYNGKRIGSSYEIDKWKVSCK